LKNAKNRHKHPNECCDPRNPDRGICFTPKYLPYQAQIVSPHCLLMSIIFNGKTVLEVFTL